MEIETKRLMPALDAHVGTAAPHRGASRHFRRSRHVWLSPRLWRSRFAFWFGGVVVGVVAVAFALAADYAQNLLHLLLERWPYATVLLTPLGFAVSATLARRYFPNSGGSGIPQAIAARRFRDPAARHALLSPRIAAGKIALTLLGLLTGASVGREGPTVQVGASIMHTVGRAAGVSPRGLILAGSAAGIAAAFNTPLAGIVFAIEEMSRSFEQRASGFVLTAVILAGIASLALVGNYTYFGHTEAVVSDAAAWVAVPLCGIVCGALGGLFSRIVVAAAETGVPGAAGRWLGRRPVLFAGVCGLLVAIIGIVSGGTTYGTGYAEARRLLEGTGDIPATYGLLKMAATTLTTISGIPGGIFAPTLAIGAGFGADIAHLLLPETPAGAVIVLGMVAYFAGMVQAPITAFVIILEMTDGRAMAIPLMAASLIAYGASRLVTREPIYHALSKRYVRTVAAAPRSV